MKFYLPRLKVAIIIKSTMAVFIVVFGILNDNFSKDSKEICVLTNLQLLFGLLKDILGNV